MIRKRILKLADFSRTKVGNEWNVCSGTADVLECENFGS